MTDIKSAIQRSREIVEKATPGRFRYDEQSRTLFDHNKLFGLPIAVQVATPSIGICITHTRNTYGLLLDVATAVDQLDLYCVDPFIGPPMQECGLCKVCGVRRALHAFAKAVEGEP